MTNYMDTFELSIVPGWIHATAAPVKEIRQGAPWEAHIPAAPFAAEETADILRELAGHPLELHALLKGQMPLWLEEDVMSQYAPDLDRATCACGQDGCDHIRLVLEEAERKFRAEPLLRLALLGLPRDQLLNAVFRDWAERVPPAAESSDGDALGKLEEKGKGGPLAGEWLAEAAEQGKLHEPGAGFRDVAVSLRTEPVDELEVDDWAALLPRVKNVQQIIRQIASDAADKARERADKLNNPAP